MALTQPLNRRDFFSVAAMSGALFGIAPTLNKCAKNSAVLTPEDRERLRHVAELQPTWVQLADWRPYVQRWMTSIGTSASVEIICQRGRRHTWYEVQLKAPRSFVFYRCPAHRVSTEDREVISALLRQAQNAPKERPLVVRDN